MKVDTIIIGSGVGGLSAAICLSKAGKKVLVLEQHDVPGGWCHSFYINGYRFTPGVHYIGQLGKGESTRQLFEGLGIANELVFFRMNPSAFEHCWLGNERIDIPAGFDQLYYSLAKQFPLEKKNLAAYLTTVKNVSSQLHLIPKMNGFWDNVTIPWRTRHLGKYGLFTLKKVIDWHIKDPLLKKILNIQCGDHGLPPSKASFPLHSAVMDHYSSGGYYPMGGGGAIVKAMTNLIKKEGSTVRTSHRVKRILLEGEEKKKAIGVELENGEEIFADNIISNADPSVTFSKLVGQPNLSKKLKKQLSTTKYSCTSLILFLTVDMDVKKAGLDSGNIWLMNGNDTDDIFKEMMTEDLRSGDEFPGIFISCTTLKDPVSFDGNYHAIEVVTYINRNAFKEFNNENQQRSAKYLKFKERLTQKIINSLERVVPGISSKIIDKELGTPVTNEYYINATEGSVYGTEKSLKQIGPFAFKPKSEIENLFLCGASIVSHGVAGASYSGVQTAALILGCKQDDLLTEDKNQELRIYNAEDASNYPDWMLQKMKVKRDRFKGKTK